MLGDTEALNDTDNNRKGMVMQVAITTQIYVKTLKRPTTSGVTKKWPIEWGFLGRKRRTDGRDSLETDNLVSIVEDDAEEVEDKKDDEGASDER